MKPINKVWINRNPHRGFKTQKNRIGNKNPGRNGGITGINNFGIVHKLWSNEILLDFGIRRIEKFGQCIQFGTYRYSKFWDKTVYCLKNLVCRFFGSVDRFWKQLLVEELD